MASAIDDLAFLAGSPTRGAVLDAVRDAERPRATLKDTVPASRVTIDRALGDLQDRGWIEESSKGYVASPTGRIMAREFAALRDRVDPVVTDAAAQVTPIGDASVPADTRGAITRAADPTLDLLGFLARAPARIEALAAVADGVTERDAIRDRLDVPGGTLRRNLAELEDRDLLERTNNHLALAPRGRTVAAAVERFRANVAAAHQLAPVIGWLPTDEFDFELAALADARVVAADWDDPTASIHHVAQRVAAADRARIVGRGAAREVIEAVHTLVVERDGRFEGVLDPDAVERLRSEPPLRDLLREILQAEGGAIRVADGPLPRFVVTVVDDDALVCGNDEGQAPHEAVEAGAEPVREWAEAVVDRAWADADPLEAAAFAP